MPRQNSFNYDPSTGTWTQNPNEGGSSSSNNTPSTPATSGESNLKASDPDSLTSTGKTEQEYNGIELNTLEGGLSFIVTEETIKLKAGDTVKLNGLGKFLSGNYFVRDVTRQISSNGYSHRATLIKTDFGSSLKTNTTVTKKVTPPKPKPQKKVPSPAPAKTTKPKKTYTVKAGDSLWAIARKTLGSGARWQEIYNANTDKCGKPYTKGGTTYCMIYPGQVLTSP